MLANTPTVMIARFKNNNKCICHDICFCEERHTKVSSLYTLIEETERAYLAENTIHIKFNNF